MVAELLLPDGRPLRVLTVRQPWAWCIFHGKGTENRTQAWKWRGALAIFSSSSGWSKRGQLAPHVCRTWWDAAHPDDPAPFGGPYISSPVRIAGTLHHESAIYHNIVPPAANLHIGAVLGVVDLVDAHWAGSDGCDCAEPWAETSYVEAGGRVRTDIAHLVLANPVQFDQPLYTSAVRGGLGLGRPSPDLVTEVAEALAGAA